VRRILRLVLALVLGCASGPVNTIAPGNEGAPNIHRFLVCAPNTAIPLPPELEEAAGPLRQQVDAYLHWHDREAEWLDFYDSRRLWGEAIAVAKNEGAIEKAPTLFVQTLAEHFQFDALVMPSVIVHQERTTSGQASWDGVDRTLHVVNAPKRIPGVSRSQRGTMVAEAGRPTADLLVTSVHVMIFTRDGQRIFEGRGGIDFIHVVDLSRFARRRKPELIVRSNLPGSIDALREGISIAFAPYLTPPEE
jgi:hypothetical protein